MKTTTNGTALEAAQIASINADTVLTLARVEATQADTENVKAQTAILKRRENL